MNLDAYDYQLPQALIATEPAKPRDQSRLLVTSTLNFDFQDRQFHELPRFLRPGDTLVLNQTKVIPARLEGRDRSGRTYELFLLEPVESRKSSWTCLVKPGKKMRKLTGPRITVGGTEIEIESKDDHFIAHFPMDEDGLLQFLDLNGETPLPPYIKRSTTTHDRETYQTVFAKHPGSVAAPTAGLHFTPNLIHELETMGVELQFVTLHVGYGTFGPVRENLDEHVMHQERYEISEKTYHALTKAKNDPNRRMIAVGTTALRALESIPLHGLKGKTQLFIRPGYQLKWVDGLITNFHLPKSTLLILVSAILGMDKTKQAYQHAVEKKYRFYSYGDAMLIPPAN